MQRQIDSSNTTPFSPPPLSLSDFASAPLPDQAREPGTFSPRITSKKSLDMSSSGGTSPGAAPAPHLLASYQAPTPDSTALFNASMAGSVLGVQTAISKGGKVNYFHRPEDQKTCLHVAAEGGYFEVCKILLQAGAVVDAVAITNKDTALILAASYGFANIVSLLLDNGANIDVENAYGNTPIHEAARHGYLDVTTVLLERGAVVSCLNRKGSTPLHVACYGADVKEFPIALHTLLVAHPTCDVNAKDTRGVTALIAACGAGREDVIKLLLDKGANGKLTDDSGMDGLATALFQRKKIGKALQKLVSKDGREVPDTVFGGM